MTTQAPSIPYASTPATIVNLSIDSLGESGKIIGDIMDGTLVAETARRNYGLVLRSLLRTAHWGFARKQATLELLGDASGSSAAPVINTVQQPWQYCYAWPQDCVLGRWMPASVPMTVGGSPANALGVPLTTGGTLIQPFPMLPARYVVSLSEDYPYTGTTGQPTSWEDMPDFQRTEGLGPVSRKIILTDNQYAQFVYTSLVTTIEMWDDLFRQAMVSLMAVVLAPVAITDPKMRSVERDKHIAMAKMMIADACVASGNEAGYPQSTDHTPPWISWRNGGTYGSWGGDSMYGGGLYAPWEPFSLGGSVF